MLLTERTQLDYAGTVLAKSSAGIRTPSSQKRAHNPRARGFFVSAASVRLKNEFMVGWTAGPTSVGPDFPFLTGSSNPAVQLATLIRFEPCLGGEKNPNQKRLSANERNIYVRNSGSRHCYRFHYRPLYSPYFSPLRPRTQRLYTHSQARNENLQREIYREYSPRLLSRDCHVPAHIGTGHQSRQRSGVTAASSHNATAHKYAVSGLASLSLNTKQNAHGSRLNAAASARSFGGS